MPSESHELHKRLRELEEAQRATLNILEDFDEERRQSQLTQKAALNILEDMEAERGRLGETQRALMNMLEDFEGERIKAEQAKVLLESVNRELEAFSYSVSHDLRAPLRAISGFSQAIEEDYGGLLDDEARRFLRLIQENVHRMGRLIDDLLAFSRLGRQQMSAGEIPLTDMARSVFEELAALEPDHRIECTIFDVPPVCGDGAMIRQVLVNLFANAIKFTRPREKALIEFGYQEAGGGAYYLRDNGVGFDMKYAGKLFGVFQRLHSAAEFEGTGVGLAIAQRIINRHDGRIWAEAVSGQGAVFYFTLPGRPG